MAALLKAVHEFAESAAQEPAGTGTAEALAQLAEEATDATLPGASGPTPAARAVMRELGSVPFRHLAVKI